VVTNQAIVNRGLGSAETVEQIHKRMVRTIRTQGGRIDAVYYCPHRPDEDCECRKPQAGMLLQAAKDFKIDLKKSYMIGDATTDVQAGQSVGCKTFLVLTGRGLESLDTCTGTVKQPFEATFDLQAAVNRISDLESYGESFIDRASVFFNVKPGGQAIVYG
jgi:HAD superfamily hydrolase (TIGR01662 family)